MSKFKIGDNVWHVDPFFPKRKAIIIKEYEKDGEFDRFQIKYDCGAETYVYDEGCLQLQNRSELVEQGIHLQDAMKSWNGIKAEVVAEDKMGFTTGKIKSDGSSSDYYKLEINGNPVEVEDIIYAMVGGDFALGNVIKACRRMYLDSKGQGKEGVDMTYDANKIKFFVDSFEKRFGGKND